MPAEDWLDSGNVVARVNLPNMRRPPGMSKVEVYAYAVRGLFDLEPDLDRRAKYMDFIDIYADLTDNERRRYRQQHPEESSMIVGLNQRAREEGRQEGERARSSSDSCAGGSARCRLGSARGSAARRRPIWRCGPTTCSTPPR